MEAGKSEPHLKWDTIRKALLAVEKALLEQHEYFTNKQSEINQIVIEMSILSQRYVILTAAPIVRDYPADIPYRIEDELLARFYAKVLLLKQFSAAFSEMITTTSKVYADFLALIKDKNLEALNKLEPIQPRIEEFIEAYSDCINAYVRLKSRLDCSVSLMTAHSIATVSHYKSALESGAELQYPYFKCRLLSKNLRK